MGNETKNPSEEGREGKMDILDFIQMIERVTEEEKNALCEALTPVLDRHIHDVFLNALHATHPHGTKPCETILAWLNLPLDLQHIFTNKQSQKCE